MLFAELIRHGKIKIRTQYLSLNMNYECAFLNNLMFENFSAYIFTVNPFLSGLKNRISSHLCQSEQKSNFHVFFVLILCKPN